MYFPKSQIQPNLYTNGTEFQKLTDRSIYTGFYFKTSTGLFYTGKTPNDGPNTQLVKLNPDTLNNQTYSPLPTTPNTIPDTLKLIVIANDVSTNGLNIPYPTQVNLSLYPKKSTFRFLPQYSGVQLTDEDIKVGVVQRYFCKKNNELIYLETNKENYNLLINRSPNIAWDLYTPISMLWYIDGGLDKAYSTNKNLASLIERNNKWYGFTQYFKDDFTKFYLES